MKALREQRSCSKQGGVHVKGGGVAWRWRRRLHSWALEWGRCLSTAVLRGRKKVWRKVAENTREVAVLTERKTSPSWNNLLCKTRQVSFAKWTFLPLCLLAVFFTVSVNGHLETTSYVTTRMSVGTMHFDVLYISKEALLKSSVHFRMVCPGYHFSCSHRHFTIVFSPGHGVPAFSLLSLFFFF